jgi:bacillithiol biosynthesis deacetylase BshB1
MVTYTARGHKRGAATLSDRDTPSEGLDLLAFAPHPDDAELLCGGTLARAAAAGRRVGLVDLTRGEMGTRGTVESRAAEARSAAEHLGLSHRENLGLPDAHLADTVEQRVAVADAVRRLRPRTIILPHVTGRHPDHGTASALVRHGAFLAGLANYAPGNAAPFKPTTVIYASAFRDHDSTPSFVVDITDTFERKMAAIRCYGSQFDGREEGGELFSTGRSFYEGLEVKFAYYGSLVQVRYGEPFVTVEPLRIDDVTALGVRSI